MRIRKRYDDPKEFKTTISFLPIKDENGVVTNPEVISRTKQEFGKEADINYIIKKAKRTGYLGDPTKNGTRKPIFGDFSSVPDYLTQQTRLARFKSEFEALPSDVRTKFKNDPANVIEFMADPKNDEEAVKLGLKPKPKPIKPDKPGVPPAEVPPTSSEVIPPPAPPEPPQ